MRGPVQLEDGRQRRDRRLVEQLADILGARVTVYRLDGPTSGLILRARYPGLVVTTGLDDVDLDRIALTSGTAADVDVRVMRELLHRARLELVVELEGTPIYAGLVGIPLEE